MDAPTPATAYILLHTLAFGDALRQRPLLGAQCRNLMSKEWRDIGTSWGIAGASYDQLGDAWTDTTEFRVLKEKTPMEKGYEACFAGQHLNPFAFDENPSEFRQWIEGYNCARGLAELEDVGEGTPSTVNAAGGTL